MYIQPGIIMIMENNNSIIFLLQASFSSGLQQVQGNSLHLSQLRLALPAFWRINYWSATVKFTHAPCEVPIWSYAMTHRDAITPRHHDNPSHKAALQKSRSLISKPEATILWKTRRNRERNQIQQGTRSFLGDTHWYCGFINIQYTGNME